MHMACTLCYVTYAYIQEAIVLSKLEAEQQANVRTYVRIHMYYVHVGG